MEPRVILVTGANGGLGTAVVEAFLKESLSNRIWMGVHSSTDRAKALMESWPGRCQTIVLDVTSQQDWKRVIGEILAVDHRVDVLVNNAGTHEDGLVAQMSDTSWSRVLATNLDAAFYGAREVLPQMVANRQGRIVNVGSLSGLMAPAGQANYSAAKAGLLALTRSLAKEVARIGITVNAVCPGYLEGDMVTSMEPAARQAALARIPMRRFGRAEEVAAVIRFLAGPEATYVNGAVVTVDGGIH
jgi:3-oxoacyl-[acyl-carrier protein] reductase